MGAELRHAAAAELDRRGARTEDAKIEDALTRAVARYVRNEQDARERPWDAFVAAVATMLLATKQRGDALFDLFVEEAGLEGALDALVLADSMGHYAEYQSPVDNIAFHRDRGGDGASRLSGGDVGIWVLARERIGAASADAFAAVHAHAKNLRRAAKPEIRCALAYAFATEPAWARQEAEAKWEPDESLFDVPQRLLLLLPSLDSVELLEKLANSRLDFTAAFLDGRVAEVIARFGLASLPFAKRLLVKRSGRPYVVDALAHLVTPGTADLFVSVIADPGAKEKVVAWLRAHPELALPALAKASGSSDKARLVAPLLASIAASNRALALATASKLPPKQQKVLASLGATETWVPRSSRTIDRILVTPIVEERARAPFAVLAAWIEKKGPARDAACIADVGRVAGPLTIALLAQLARAAATNGGTACAQAIVDALEENGSHAAVREIARMTVGLTESTLSAHAEQALARLAERLGLDDEDMLDRAVPDFGVDSALIRLDFGPRAFRVELDADFGPTLLDHYGAKMKSLPRPNKKDDPEKAAIAVERWSALRGEARAEARQQAQRFESAMVAGRSWRIDSLTDVVLRHPILSRIALRILWSTTKGRTFRVAEDFTFADVHDEQITIDGDVHVVHPIELDDTTLVAWAHVFGEYEIIPPFEQLARAAARLEDPSANGIRAALSVYENQPVTRAARHILEAQGWSDTYHYTSLQFTRSLRGHEARIELSLDAPDGNPTSLMSASLALPARGDLDPIVWSELARDLAKIVRSVG